MKSKFNDMHESGLAPLLRGMSRVRKLHQLVLWISFKLEGRYFYSRTARWLMARYYGIHVGDYSYGPPCFTPNWLPDGTVIGRYVSIAAGVRVFSHNHPSRHLSTHPFFFNEFFGFMEKDCIPRTFLTIGPDVWIGANAIILPQCQRIGVGAIVGAGSVVTRDVPDFAIVAGVPARVVRMRFTDDLCRRVLESKWWELPVGKCVAHLREMSMVLDENHPLLKGEK